MSAPKRSNLKRPNVEIGQQIALLFQMADDVFAKSAARANRYVFLARKLAMRHKQRIPSVFQRRFCKHCYAYVRSGASGRIRLQKGNVVMTCFSCKKQTRFGYGREQRAARRLPVQSP